MTKVTDEQIKGLLAEARVAGDHTGDGAQVALCLAALAGDEQARTRCARVIADAAAAAEDAVRP